MKSLKKLYKLDSKGKTRVWWIDIDGDAYRTVSGILDGNLVESDFKVAKPKNIGKSNETTGPEQAQLEADSIYENKLTHEKYTDDLSKVEENNEGGYFEPMLADKWDDSKGKEVGKKHTIKAFASGKRVFVQPKLDGYRCVGQKTGLTTRSGETYKTVPHIKISIASAVQNGLILDGELYNHQYHDNFNQIQKMIAPMATPTSERLEKTLEFVQYHVYDVFDLNHPNANFSERSSTLQFLKDKNILNDHIVIVPTFEVHSVEEIEAKYGEFIEQGYEGLMVRIDTPYENKRTKNLIKLKPEFDEEYLIEKVNEGEGNWSGKAKTVSCTTKEGEKFDATLKGTMEANREVLEKKNKIEGKLWCTVTYTNKTPDGIPRFPRVKEIWWDGKRSM